MSGVTEENAREERLAAYVAGKLPDAEAKSLEEEILSDPALAEELYADANLTAALDAAAERRREKVVPWRSWVGRHLRIVVPLAVAATAMLVLLPRGEKTGPGDETFRSEGTARLLAPVGAIDGNPSTFTWSRDEGAALYRMELYDEEAELRFRATTAETTLTVPDEAWAGRPFVAGYWKVVPMTAAGVERPGPPPVSIRVRGGR